LTFYLRDFGLFHPKNEISNQFLAELYLGTNWDGTKYTNAVILVLVEYYAVVISRAFAVLTRARYLRRCEG
jgi:hypothetical protein